MPKVCRPLLPVKIPSQRDITASDSIPLDQWADLSPTGFRVFATARNTEVLKDLEDLGLETFGLDVTSQSSIDGAKDEVARRTRGGLDWLVNNA